MTSFIFYVFAIVAKQNPVYHVRLNTIQRKFVGESRGVAWILWEENRFMIPGKGERSVIEKFEMDHFQWLLPLNWSPRRHHPGKKRPSASHTFNNWLNLFQSHHHPMAPDSSNILYSNSHFSSVRTSLKGKERKRSFILYLKLLVTYRRKKNRRKPLNVNRDINSSIPYDESSLINYLVSIPFMR